MLANDACNIEKKIIKKKKNHNRVQVMFTAVAHTLVQFSSQNHLSQNLTPTHILVALERSQQTNKQTNMSHKKECEVVVSSS
jgi:hypothetical protein